MTVKISNATVVRLRDLAAMPATTMPVAVTGRLLRTDGRLALADGADTVPVCGADAPAFAWVTVTGTWQDGHLHAGGTTVIRAPQQSPASSDLPEARVAVRPLRAAAILHNAVMLRELRRFLDTSGFIEVKTPMLQAAPEISFFHQGRTQPMHGTVFHLRTDPEEYLKRYLTAGLDAVYEISTNVRDDADDVTHLTEFQSLEFYRRQLSFEGALQFADELMRHVARRLAAQFTARHVGLDPVAPYPRLRYAELTRKHTGIDIGAPACATTDGLAAAVRAAGLACAPSAYASGWRRDLLDAIFDEHVLPGLNGPTWVTHFPDDLAYSYRVDPGDPRWTLRAELYLPGGLEIAHVYENLTVEAELRARYEERLRHRVAGGLDRIDLNEALMESARIGMPPMGGGAIGIERLLMAMLDDGEIGAGALFGREITRARSGVAR